MKRDWVPSYLQGETKEELKQKREFVALFRYTGDICKGANFGIGRKKWIKHISSEVFVDKYLYEGERRRVVKDDSRILVLGAKQMVGAIYTNKEF